MADDFSRDPRQFFTSNAQGRAAAKLCDTLANVAGATGKLHAALITLRIASFHEMRYNLRDARIALGAAKGHLEEAAREIEQYQLDTFPRDASQSKPVMDKE